MILDEVIVFFPHLAQPSVSYGGLNSVQIASVKAAVALAQKATVIVLWPGKTNQSLDLEHIKRDLQALGVQKVVLADSRAQDAHIIVNNTVRADVLTKAIGQLSPDLVLLPSSVDATDVVAMSAVEIDSGAITDASDLTLVGGALQITKQVLTGSWNTSTTATRGVPLVTVKADVKVNGQILDTYSLQPAEQIEVSTLEVSLTTIATCIEVLAYDNESHGTISCAEAEVVVCAGRGVNGDLSLVQQLAYKLGGAVGATRVATDEGWIERSCQIGQTGLTIAPKLYIGVGVSGQVHHTAGMQSSKQVVAIVDDPEAPIIQIADLAIIGDLNTVIPQALELL